jgi:hypothetical protein
VNWDANATISTKMARTPRLSSSESRIIDRDMECADWANVTWVYEEGVTKSDCSKDGNLSANSDRSLKVVTVLNAKTL